MTKKLKEEFKQLNPKEVYIAIRDNSIYGFLGATIFVFISARVDIAVLFAYLIYYFFLGKVVNRPKYVTKIGKFILFPIPTALGAFTGYKIAQYISLLL